MPIKRTWYDGAQEAQADAAALEALEAELSIGDTLLFRSLAERSLAAERSAGAVCHSAPASAGSGGSSTHGSSRGPSDDAEAGGQGGEGALDAVGRAPESPGKSQAEPAHGEAADADRCDS